MPLLVFSVLINVVVWRATQGRPEGKFPSVTEETFEQLMDAFEKEALRKNPPPALHDEEVEVGFSGVAFRRRVAGQQKARHDSIAQFTPCCVCWHVGSNDRNPLVFCSRCHLAVHAGCYGIEKKRGGSHPRASMGGRPWFCTHCEEEVEVLLQQAIPAATSSPSKVGDGAAANASPSPDGSAPVLAPSPTADPADSPTSAADSPKSAAAAVSASSPPAATPPAQVIPGWGVGSGQCCLCPVRGGALKPTDDGRWCHLVCAIWIPEPCISEVSRMQPIERVNKINSKRWQLHCAICNKDDVGPCIECSEPGCVAAFHPSCAYTASPDYCLQASLQVDRQAVSFEAFCPAHNTRMIERSVAAIRQDTTQCTANQNVPPTDAWLRVHRSDVPTSPVPSPQQPMASPVASDSGSAAGDPPWSLDCADATAAAAASSKHDHLSCPIVTYTKPPTSEVAYWRPAESATISDGAERCVLIPTRLAAFPYMYMRLRNFPPLPAPVLVV